MRFAFVFLLLAGCATEKPPPQVIVYIETVKETPPPAAPPPPVAAVKQAYASVVQKEAKVVLSPNANIDHVKSVTKADAAAKQAVQELDVHPTKENLEKAKAAVQKVDQISNAAHTGQTP